jgi:hypothetical protein
MTEGFYLKKKFRDVIFLQPLIFFNLFYIIKNPKRKSIDLREIYKHDSHFAKINGCASTMKNIV